MTKCVESLREFGADVAQGGTHVERLRTGLTEALREYCEFRSLLLPGRLKACA